MRPDPDEYAVTGDGKQWGHPSPSGEQVPIMSEDEAIYVAQYVKQHHPEKYVRLFRRPRGTEVQWRPY